MRLEFHPKAEGEVESTVDWYEGQRVGLGAEFGDGVPFNGQVLRRECNLEKSDKAP